MSAWVFVLVLVLVLVLVRVLVLASVLVVVLALTCVGGANCRRGHSFWCVGNAQCVCVCAGCVSGC